MQASERAQIWVSISENFIYYNSYFFKNKFYFIKLKVITEENAAERLSGALIVLRDAAGGFLL